MLNARNMIVFAVDTFLVTLAYSLSFVFRFDFSLPPDMRELFWQGLCVVLVIKPAVFLGLGFYGNLWRYASLHDAVNILKAVLASSLAAAFIILFFRHFTPFPRSVIVVDAVLLLFLLSASRLAWRFIRERHSKSVGDARPKALIIGAGEAGSLLLKEIRRQACPSYQVMGFVDDDKSKQGMYLHGVRVLGNLADLRAIVAKQGIDELIIAIPSAKGKALRNIVEHCKKTGVRFRTVPAMGDIIDCKVSISQIRDVEIDELLGREPVVLDEAKIRDYLHGKTVLISGAAGSIGSEICRQVAKFDPGTLVLLDNAETPLFYIERELTAGYPGLVIIPIIGDVKNREKVDAVFGEFLPDVVFHAAAYKHVPMMEFNPAEAVSNNIRGTKIMADASHRFGVGNFVMISTDKAVNPTNVMGATKRAAEIYVQALSRKSTTKFVTVRFGNVLGSNGSVIPLFMEQIKKGGPVTVTDPDVIRYFMTIPEASQLVLQAGCLGRGGEIFVLDMGEPVRIANLAKDLIKLSGLTPYEDIDIVFTGLRPGEKLFEELLISGEGILPTTHEKIRVVSALGGDLQSVSAEFERLFKQADNFDTHGIIHSLCLLVTEFKPGQCHARPVQVNFQRTRMRQPQKGKAATAKVIPISAGLAGRDRTA